MEAEAIKAFYFRELDIPEAPLLVDPPKISTEVSAPRVLTGLTIPSLGTRVPRPGLPHTSRLSFLLPDLQGVIAIMDWFDLGGMSW